VQVQVQFKVQVAGAGQQAALAKQTPTEQLIGCPAGSGRREGGARSLAQSAGTTQVAGDNRDQTLKRESATIIGQRGGGACRVPKYVLYSTPRYPGILPGLARSAWQPDSQVVQRRPTGFTSLRLAAAQEIPKSDHPTDRSPPEQHVRVAQIIHEQGSTVPLEPAIQSVHWISHLIRHWQSHPSLAPGCGNGAETKRHQWPSDLDQQKFARANLGPRRQAFCSGPWTTAAQQGRALVKPREHAVSTSTTSRTSRYCGLSCLSCLSQSSRQFLSRAGKRPESLSNPDNGCWMRAYHHDAHVATSRVFYSGRWYAGILLT
jgi:hypothetical protein